MPTAPLHRYVSRYAAEAGATVYSDGLAEYEALDGRRRRRHADPRGRARCRATIFPSARATPDGRPTRRWPSRSASIGPSSRSPPHGPDTPAQRHEVECLADDVLLPLTGRTLRSNLAAPTIAGGLVLEGEGLAFSAAMPARESGWIVLRCVNRFDGEVRGRWCARRPIAEAKLARLDETPLEGLEVHGDAVPFTAPPHAIVTLLVRWSETR